MTDENYEASAQAHLASLKRDMRVSLEDAVVRAAHKVMAEFEAKSDERLMEDWGPGPHECHSLPARGADQPAQQEPLFWYRPRSDGFYEGPIHNAQIEQIRKDSGGWQPLYTRPQAREPEQPTTPQGWKLVPVKPTPEQIKSGNKVTWPMPCKQVYTTMLAAAPQPAQQDPVAYGMLDTQLGKGNRMMMVRLDKGQDGCTVPLYTSQPAQRKPLTHEQRVDLLAKFEAHKHEWHAPAILIDMVEAAHGIKGDA